MAMPGNGNLTVTGQLGDVMRESAQAAVSYVRASSRLLGIDDDYFAKHDLHIHVPAGAIPKDGPSAGVTMATAVCSLVTGRPISADVAMTGEITLTGQVLPIGGLKEKTLAAQRAGITTVIVPTRNVADLEDVPEELRKDMTFVPADRVEQVWKAAMGLEIDGKVIELVEAQELVEDLSELLQKARRGAPVERAAEAAAKKPAVAKKAAVKKSAAAAKTAAKRPVARKSAAKPTVKRPAAKPVAPARPKAVPARQTGAAKKTTAARGKSGRKK